MLSLSKHAPRSRLTRFLTGGLLALSAVLAVPSRTEAADRLADYFGATSDVSYIEVYHVSTRTVYRSALSLDRLISVERADAYVRIAGNDRAARDLYEALNETVVFEKACDRYDLRWALVLNYRDRPRKAVGFGPFYGCVQLLSGEGLTVSPALFEYVLRTFPFMR